MAPLSKKLTGLILPHDNYGSHLNERGITIDADLEKNNFEFVGVTLAEILSQIIVDKFPTVADTSSNRIRAPGRKPYVHGSEMM